MAGSGVFDPDLFPSRTAPPATVNPTPLRKESAAKTVPLPFRYLIVIIGLGGLAPGNDTIQGELVDWNLIVDPPKYWKNQYGLDDFGEFAMAIRPAFSWMPESPAKDLAVEQAYRIPVVPAFSQAVAWASRNLRPNPQGAVANDVIQALIDAQGPLVGVDPMTMLVIADCFQVSIQGTVGGRAVDNVIGVRNASGTAAGAAAAVKAAWEAVGGPIKKGVTNQYTVAQYVATDISSSSGTIATLTGGGTGGVTGQISTSASAALVSWNGSSRDRTTRGRMYLGPLGEGFVDSNGRTLVSGGRTDIQAGIDQFVAALGTANYPLVVLSRTKSRATLVTAATVQATIATQRRRIRS